MKKLWRNLLIILSISNIFFGCSKQTEETFIQIDDRIPDEQADSIHVFSTKGEKLEYEMTAKHMNKFYDTQETFADSVYVIFYEEDGSLKSTLKADQAILNDAENILRGIGNVVIVSENGTMQAPLVVWDRNTNIVLAQKGVTLIRNNNVLHGKEMETDLYLDKVKIIDVSAEGELEDEEFDW